MMGNEGPDRSAPAMVEKSKLVSQRKTVDVDTGEIRVSSEPVRLQAIALGSCVAVMVYEPDKKIGGLAHIMLPGRSPSSKDSTKYVENAIDALMSSVEKLGARTGDLEISIVGGANVLQEGDIPDKVIESVLGCLGGLDMELTRMRVGGNERRSAFLETKSGNVYYTEGESNTRILLTAMERIQYPGRLE